MKKGSQEGLERGLPCARRLPSRLDRTVVVRLVGDLGDDLDVGDLVACIHDKDGAGEKPEILDEDPIVLAERELPMVRQRGDGDVLGRAPALLSKGKIGA